MSGGAFAVVHNGQAIPVHSIPEVSFAVFRDTLLGAAAGGQRAAALFGHCAGPADRVTLWAVLADSTQALLRVGRTKLGGDCFPSLTPDCPQLHLFEREVAEQYGVRPVGHPWFKPVRFHGSYRPGHDAWGRPGGKAPVIGVMDYYRVEGEEVHEVGVGPVHAGIIEPGHFRFQCHGENVLHLEISLGYQHRGIERALIGGPGKRTLPLMETVAGDTSVGHATGYCQAVEALAGCSVPVRAEALCGSRFGRGMVRPGGVGFDLDAGRRKLFLERLEAACRDVAEAVNLLWESASVQARFEGTGTVSPGICHQLGLVGPAARACGIERDVRHDFPSGIFRFAQVPVSTWQTGDVFARAYVRWLEIQRSAAFVRGQLEALPDGPIRAEVGSLKPEYVVVTLNEGWRGEICHVALTDPCGRFERYKVVDPSFHNWMGLAMALRDQQISDFPLCNKSFNLSYCGHDL